MAKFECPQCDFHTHSERGLKRHITVKHKEDKEKGNSPDLDNTVSLEDVAGKVEIPIESVSPDLADPPPQQTEPEPEPVPSESKEDVPEEIFVDSPDNPVEIDPSKVEPKELDLESLGITDIPVGAIVKLNGSFWFKTPDQPQYDPTPVEAIGVICEVFNKFAQGDHSYLQLKVEGGEAEWCCAEQSVFDGDVKLLYLTKPTPVPEDTTDEIVDPPEEDVEESDEKAPEALVEPPFDKVDEPVVLSSEPATIDPEAFEEAANRNSPSDGSRDHFVQLVQEYAEARDAKLDAEKDYKLVDNANREAITQYLTQNGQPSGDGKNDHMVVADGFKVHWTFTPGKPGIKRDVAAILQWCMDNGHFYALEAALNEEVWEKMVENGMVPAETLSKLQEPTQGKDSRKLLVEKLQS